MLLNIEYIHSFPDHRTESDSESSRVDKIIASNKTKWEHARIEKEKTRIYSLQKRWQLGRPTALTIEGEIKLERGHAVLVRLERRDPSHVIWFLLKFNKNSTASNTTGFLLALREHITGDPLQQIRRQQHLRAVQVAALRLLQLGVQLGGQPLHRLLVLVLAPRLALIRYPRARLLVVVVVVVGVAAVVVVTAAPRVADRHLGWWRWGRRWPLEGSVPIWRELRRERKEIVNKYVQSIKPFSNRSRRRERINKFPSI